MKNEIYEKLFNVQDFGTDSLEEFTLKSPKETNPVKARINYVLSFFCNGFSIMTATSLLFWYLGEEPFTFLVAASWVGGVTVLILLEISKRYTFSSVASRFVGLRRVAFRGILLSLFLVGTSVSVSYKGGVHLPDLLTPTPARAVNPEIDSLSRQLATIDEQIKIHEANREKSTGQIRWNSEVAIKDLTSQRGPINQRLMLLKGKDDVGHEKAIQDQDEKNWERGLILAFLAILSDIGLILLIYRNKVLKYEVARMIAIERKQIIAGMKADDLNQTQVNQTASGTAPQSGSSTVPSPGTQPGQTTVPDPQANGQVHTKNRIGFDLGRLKKNVVKADPQTKVAQPSTDGTQIPQTPTPAAPVPAVPSVLTHQNKETQDTVMDQDTEQGQSSLLETIKTKGVEAASEVQKAQLKLLLNSDDYKGTADLSPGILNKRLKQYQKRLKQYKANAHDQATKGQVSQKTQNAIQNNQRWVIIYQLRIQNNKKQLS